MSDLLDDRTALAGAIYVSLTNFRALQSSVRSRGSRPAPPTYQIAEAWFNRDARDPAYLR